MSDDLKEFTHNCLHCRKAFTIKLTDEEFARSRLHPITVTSICPHCGTRHRCKISVNGAKTSIHCEFA